MGEMMTRQTSSKHASPYKEKKPEGSPFLKKPASLFDKKPLVFHTTSPPPVHQNPSASPSSPSAPRKSNFKKCSYCGDAHSVKSCNTFKALDVTARAEWVKEKRLCFRCLNGAHRIAECDSTAICKVEGCTQRHHPLLHGAPRVFPINPATSSSTTPKNKPVAMTTIDNEPDDSTSLAIVSVIVSANGIDFSTFAFLDQEATLNIIREDIAEKLKCSGKKKRVSFGSFHGMDPEFDSMKISVTIKSLDRSFEAELEKVSTVPKEYLKLPRPLEELKEVRERYAHLRDIKFAALGQPTMLIGGGNQWLHLRMDERRPPNGINAPFGIRTPFGWTCVGETLARSKTLLYYPGIA